MELLLLSLVIVVGVIWVIYFLPSYLTHIKINLDQNVPYDYVTFNTFLEEFSKYENDPDLEKGEFKGKSIFLRKDYNKYIVYLHADIVKFNDKCMIFYPLSYLKYRIWLRKINHISRKRVKGLWNSK